MESAVRKQAARCDHPHYRLAIDKRGFKCLVCVTCGIMKGRHPSTELHEYERTLELADMDRKRVES